MPWTWHAHPDVWILIAVFGGGYLWALRRLAPTHSAPGAPVATRNQKVSFGLGLAALFGTRARPRLRADASGVTVRGLSAARHHPWAQVTDVRVLPVRRLGRTSTLLEIDVTEPDGSERMMIFGRLELDDDPADVAEAIHAIRPGR